MLIVFRVKFILCLCVAASVADDTPGTPDTSGTEIEQLKSVVSRLTEKVDYLMQRERRSVDRQVASETTAFTAYLDHEEAVHPNGALKFNKVLYNSGNAYNAFTGIFTAPFNGTYLLSYHIEHWTTQNTVGTLVVDGVRQVSAVVHSHGYSTQSGNTVVLGLSAGQSVWVECSEGTMYGSSTFRGTVFSGTLIMY